MSKPKPPSPDVRALVLDIGEVLLRLDFSRLLAALSMNVDRSVGRALASLNKWELYDRYERGGISEAGFRESLGKLVGRPIGHAEFLEIWNSPILGPVEGIEPLVKTLAGKLPLYALTNSNETHMRFVFREYPWFRHFRKVFMSNELGVRKPEPEIFGRTAREAGIAPADSLFIDDRPENVEGAKLAGFQAEVCRESPRELLEILKRYRILD